MTMFLDLTPRSRFNIVGLFPDPGLVKLYKTGRTAQGPMACPYCQTAKETLLNTINLATSRRARANIHICPSTLVVPIPPGDVDGPSPEELVEMRIAEWFDLDDTLHKPGDHDETWTDELYANMLGLEGDIADIEEMNRDIADMHTPAEVQTPAQAIGEFGVAAKAFPLQEREELDLSAQAVEEGFAAETIEQMRSELAETVEGYNATLQENRELRAALAAHVKEIKALKASRDKAYNIMNAERELKEAKENEKTARVHLASFRHPRYSYNYAPDEDEAEALKNMAGRLLSALVEVADTCDNNTDPDDAGAWTDEVFEATHALVHNAKAMGIKVTSFPPTTETWRVCPKCHSHSKESDMTWVADTSFLACPICLKTSRIDDWPTV